MCDVYVYIWIQCMYVCMGSHIHMSSEQLNSSTHHRHHIVCDVLIQEVLHRDDGVVAGVSTLNDLGVVQSRVFHEVSIHTLVVTVWQAHDQAGLFPPYGQFMTRHSSEHQLSSSCPATFGHFLYKRQTNASCLGNRGRCASARRP